MVKRELKNKSYINKMEKEKWDSSVSRDSSGKNDDSEGTKGLFVTSKSSFEDSKVFIEDSKELFEDSSAFVGVVSLTSKSERNENENSIESEKEDSVFLDLDEIKITGGLKDVPGYYDFYAEHQPSSLAELISSKKKFTGESKKRKSLFSVKGRKAKSVEKYYPKLIEYKSKIEV